ncbi:MAG: c-type cytochrome [Actinomycetia bacterium]|nr:c-type cytochrome [Actinomycetes bacterium]
MATRLRRITFTGPLSVALLAILVMSPALGQTNTKPIADITATPSSGDVGSFIFFDATASRDADGTIATYVWDFGDGSPVVTVNALEAEQIYHSFGTSGTYTVSLIVTDDQGLESDPAGASSSLSVSIGVPPTPTTTTPPTVSGSSLFASTCAACHTKANLSGRGLSSAQLVTIMSSGAMKSQASSLNATQIKAVADYISPGGATPPTPATTTTTTPAGTNPPTASGSSLFASSCAACHTKANLSGRGLSSAQLVTIMSSGAMKSQASSLNATQIKAVARYLTPASSGGTNPTTTTTTPGAAASGSSVYTAKCAACHGSTGEGGVGPSLRTSTWSKSATLDAVANGVGSMPGFSSALSSAEVDAVSSYSVRLQSATTTAPTDSPQNVEGSDIYTSECAACHGASGEGGTGYGPSLRTSFMSLAQTTSAITNGIGGMPSFDTKLDESQIASVASFSVAFQTAEPLPEPEVEVPGDGSEAAVAYDANCAACHGAQGEGGIGPSLQTSTAGVDATIGAIAHGVGTMPGFSAGLTEEMIAALAEYSVGFQSGQPGEPAETGTTGSAGAVTAEGAQLFASNCAICHGATGEGASAAPINVPFANEQLVEIIQVGIADMPGFASALSDEQIVVLADYVHALAAEAAPTTTVAASGNEYIVAIQPSKYVEFDTDRTSVPLDANARVGLALASIALLGAIAYWQVQEAKDPNDVAPDGAGD